MPRNTLGIASYMDMTLPSEVDITILEDSTLSKMDCKELEDYYGQLEYYCNLKSISRSWLTDDIKPFYTLSREEKESLTKEQLKRYHSNLRDYYLETVNKTHIKRLSKKEEDTLSEIDYLIYLKDLRLHDEKSKIMNMSKTSRKLLHPELHLLLKGNRISSGIKVRKLNTKIPDEIKNRPKIFVVTHVGKDDIAVFNEIVKSHYIILSGDYESLHNNMEGLVTMLNEVIFFDMKSNSERKTIVPRVSSKLKEGNDILCSMEAAWNLYAAKLVDKLYPGMIKATIDCIDFDAVIIPVGIERFDSKLFGINISQKYFDPREYFKEKEVNKYHIYEAGEYIRELLAEAKFELYFSKSINKKITTTRESIGSYDDYNRTFKEDILKGWTFTEEAIKQKAFQDMQAPEYAFSYMKDRCENLLKMSANGMENQKFNQDFASMIGYVRGNQLPNDINNYMMKTIQELTSNNVGDNVAKKIVKRGL